MILHQSNRFDDAEAFLAAHGERFLQARARNEGWSVVHATEVRRAFGFGMVSPASQHGRSLVLGIAAWLDYAEAHEQRFEDGIGNDYVLGPEWACWGRALLGLLNGETGGLDCGTLDALIRDTLRKHEIEAEG